LHHYRVTVNGPHAALESVLAEIARDRAPPAMSTDTRCVLLASADRIDCWEELSRRHPEVRDHRDHNLVGRLTPLTGIA
jgi:hypothetical protein